MVSVFVPREACQGQVPHLHLGTRSAWCESASRKGTTMTIEDQVKALEVAKAQADATAIREEVAGLLAAHDIPVARRNVVGHFIASQTKRDASGDLVLGSAPLHEAFPEWLATPEGQSFGQLPGAASRKVAKRSEAEVLGRAIANGFTRGGR